LLRALFTSLRRSVERLDRIERAILVALLVLHGAALFWGLPSSDAWDNDGIAPRDVLPGLIETFTPGRHYTYPPLQLLLLAALTLPVSVVALVRSPTFQQVDLVRSFLDPRVMTAFSVVARAVSLVFSLGVVLAMGELAALIAGPAHKRARAFGMALAGVDVAFTYYAQTSNLDVPYLFWSSLALVAFAKSVAEDRPRALRRSAVFAALAIATKDQAYALFLLSLPSVAVLWAAARARTGGASAARALLREALIASALGIGVVLAIDGAIYNPKGFAARVRFLLGPASQDFAQYSKDLAGHAAAFADSWLPFPHHYPIVLAPIFALGLLLSLRDRSRPRARLVALLPLLAALSFTLTFNCWARRVEERFVMPQMILVSVYGAVALARAESALRARAESGRGKALRAAFEILTALAFGWALRMSASVDAVMLHDPRYEAEAWLAAHARPEDTIEVYGMNVYLPRFAPWMHVVRVGDEPLARRNPMPGVVEVDARYGDIESRRPRFVVVGEGFAWRYLIGVWGGADGRVQPLVHRENLADHDETAHFHRLFDHTGAYQTALHARYESALFPIVRMHGSLGAEVFVFERRP
jgi:hypothetical protein